MEEFDEYFKEVKIEAKSGQSTELTFRTPLKNFLESLFPILRLSEENKKIKGIGKPDYTCFKNKIKVGYIETKDLGIISSEKELKDVLDSEQIVRYSTDAIPNMILTDYCRFVLYREKEILLDIRLFEPDEVKKGKTFDEKKINSFKQIIESFLSYSLPTIKNATELAIELSKRAKLLRDWSAKQLENDFAHIKINEATSSIYDFYLVFKELIKDANPLDCVDAYAQTITYGLFLSKIGSGDGLDRTSAVNNIPSSIKIIKKIFQNITGDELPKEISWIIDEIVDILNATDIQRILADFTFEGKNYRDPFIHFYEDFLEEYDPKKRKRLGVYYTPEPIVSFITNSINKILQEEFKKENGFADDSITVLDPATGTGTFIANAFVIALNEIRQKGLGGIEKDKIKNHLLKHFYGFEILVSPYVISHLKLSTLLRKEGYDLSEHDRIQVYLTNTLDPSEITQNLGAFLKELTQETEMANRIKISEKILVVMGNPPYSVSSSNKSEWITNLMKDYKKDLNERNIQPLDDDYIKFIRFAQWKIEQNKEGIFGVITNNRYLDGIIHRQMRKELMNSFNQIYLLNLHGSSKRVVRAKDENVFDIQQGVSIGIFVKSKGKKQVFYSELLGSRESKYARLYEHDVKKIEWRELKPSEPYYFFIKKDDTGSKKYGSFYSLKDIFQEFNMGVATGKDSEFVAFTKDDLKLKFGEDEFISSYAYRVFDTRYIYYDTKKIQRAREKLMRHLRKDNMALVCTKYVSLNGFQHAFVTNTVTDRCLISLRTSEGGYVFPLYCYNQEKETTQQVTLSGQKLGKLGKQPNFKQEFETFLSVKYPKQTISPEEMFGYIYSVLHSTKYRRAFNEFLKTDFPRIPFVDDYNKFKKLSELGNEMVEYHLLKKVSGKKTVRFEVSGTGELTTLKYDNKKVFINDKQYFNGVSEEVWNFYIGGYRVLDKWLKSRKGQKLTSKEVETFIKIANVLSETIEIMEKIDKIKIF